MIAEDLLNQMIPPLKVSDTVGKAAKWLEEFHVSQLPVLDNRAYRGLVTDADLLDFEEADKSNQLLSNLALGFTDAYVLHGQHFYSIMEVAIENKIQLVPVLDERQEYMGVVTVSDTLAAFGQPPIAIGQGAVIVMSMEERDYSLSTISRYVEENNAKILSAHVAQDEHDPYRIRLTLKVNTPILTRIAATLERFGYIITAQFNGVGELGENEQERYDALLRYLSL